MLVTWSAFQTWLASPRKAIQRASQQLAADATAERKEGVAYQAQLKGGLQQLLTNDVTTATRHSLARASEQLLAAASAATGHHLGLRQSTGRKHNGVVPVSNGIARLNMYERDQQRMRGGMILPAHTPTATDVRGAFRSRYLPIDLTSPASPLCYVPPDCLADAVTGISETCVRDKRSGAQAFVRFTIGLEDTLGGDPDDQVLHAFGADRADEDTIFVPRGAGIAEQPPLATDGAGAATAADRIRSNLRLGDKAYWLVASVVTPPDLAAAHPIVAGPGRVRAAKAVRT